MSGHDHHDEDRDVHDRHHDDDHHDGGHHAGHDDPHKAPPNPYLEPRRTPEENAALEQRVRSIEALLIEKGLVSKGALDKLVDIYEHDLGPMNGARVVARAWVDPDYRRRLLDDATAAIAELGFGGLQGEHMVAVENTPEVHNVVVCTLCSCYPWPVLGLPPTWYKSAPYRSRVVLDPRGVLREMGLQLGDDVEVRVWDSSAEIRYLVLPERPAGTDDLDEDQLAELVTRDAMIGVAKVQYLAP
jgi:nitrile hydratase